MLLCVCGGARGRKGTAKALLGLLASGQLPQPTSAHNWMNGPRRGGGAGTHNPCARKSSPFPHVKVNRGQPFNIEWSSGHGGPILAVLVHARDEDKLKLNKNWYIPMLYLHEAPPGAISRYDDPVWDKYHLGWPGGAGGFSDDFFLSRGYIRSTGWDMSQPVRHRQLWIDPNAPIMMRPNLEDYWSQGGQTLSLEGPFGRSLATCATASPARL